MLEKLEKYIKENQEFVANTLDDVENFRIKYLGKKGIVNDLFEDFKNVPRENKKEVGQKLNELKTLIQNKINEFKSVFEESTTTKRCKNVESFSVLV